MNRTLAGHLDDLDLDEVVRVVALSRRSGVLTLDSPEGDAELTFSGGRVVSGRRNGANDTVGDVLVRAGVLGSADLARIGDEAESLDDLLRRVADERPAEVDVAARAEGVLEQSLRGLIAEVLLYRTGSFAFRVADAEGVPTRYLGDTGFTVTRGINAEELARDAKRRRQGRRRDLGLGLGAKPNRGSSEESPVELFIVDDDADFRARVDRQASAAGLGVHVIEHARAAIEQLKDLRGTARRLMVVDLVMPRVNGRGILGGLEVLRHAHDEGCADQVFLALEGAHDDAAAIAKELGAAGVLLKPTEDTGSLPSFAPFLNPVLERLGRPALLDEPIDLVEQLRTELGEWIEGWSEGEHALPVDAAKDLRVLKSLLGELNTPSFEEEIPLLVLRFASAFFARAAVFHVHEDEGSIVGVGAYGITSSDTGRTIHAIRLPLEADTVFTRCIREAQGVPQPFYESEWNNRLVSALGGPRPREVYTAPLFSSRGLEAVLYADNALDNKPFADLALLEIFLMQSGAAMERLSMKRRLEDLAVPNLRESA